LFLFCSNEVERRSSPAMAAGTTVNNAIATCRRSQVQ
jgi:hypothetical protein